MNLLEVLKAKVEELGEDKVCELLESPRQMIRQFVSGKKAPTLKTCQKILDNWSNGQDKEADNALKEIVDLWQGRDVCLCLPWYKDLHPNTFLSVLAMWDKTRMRCELRCDDSMITRSRNQLARRFLKTEAKWSVWFDSDMIFPFGNAGIYATITGMRTLPSKYLAMNTIDRLLSHGKTIVGGCYWDRRGGGKLIAGGGGPILNPIPSDMLHPVSFVGTGCLLIHRQVFLDIAAKFPDTYSDESLGNECGFFTNIQTPQRMLGEDESFAKRATDAGHPSYLDLGLICGHMGMNVHGIPSQGSKI